MWLGPGRALADGEVVVDGGRVVSVGPSGATPTDRVLEVDGFLMPGVADRHVHVGLSDPAAILQGGVTAARDLGWPAERIFPVADASELPTFTGPLIRAVGPMLTAPGGYPTRAPWAPAGTGRELASPTEAEVAVDDLAGRGAVAIKVALNADAGPVLGDAELAAIVAAAAERGLPVTAHCQGVGQVGRAAGAGVAELAHTPWSERLPDALVAALAATTRIVSTLDIQSYGRDTPEIRTALDNLRRFHAAGGRIAYGTDLGNGPITPGIHLTEVFLLRDAGLAADELLGAMAFGPLEPGAPADLLALGSDPREDLTAFEDVVAVIRGGRLVAGRG